MLACRPSSCPRPLESPSDHPLLSPIARGRLDQIAGRPRKRECVRWWLVVFGCPEGEPRETEPAARVRRQAGSSPFLLALESRCEGTKSGRRSLVAAVHLRIKASHPDRRRKAAARDATGRVTRVLGRFAFVLRGRVTSSLPTTHDPLVLTLVSRAKPVERDRGLMWLWGPVILPGARLSVSLARSPRRIAGRRAASNAAVISLTIADRTFSALPT